MAIIDNIFDSFKDIFNPSLSPISSASESSALSESRKAAQEANAFNAAQAALNRQFQQSSAERSMSVSSLEADKARQFSAQEAQKTRDWQERMSNTSYQRAMADLQSAGLNPILLYSSLNGSSTPSGSTASSFAGSGSSASGSSASGYMADLSAAKRADLEVLGDLVPLLLVQTLSTALDNAKELGEKAKKGIDKVTEKIDKYSDTKKAVTSAGNSVLKWVGNLLSTNILGFPIF